MWRPQYFAEMGWGWITMGLGSLELEYDLHHFFRLRPDQLGKAYCDIHWNNHLHHSQCPRYRFQSLQVVPRTFLQALQLYEIIIKKV
jgi:hypothetical protein